MKYFLVIVVFAIIFVIFQAINTKRLIAIGINIRDNTVLFSRHIENASSRILLIGDSTAVGVGADSPEFSIAGRVAQTFPNTTIVNKGISGEKAQELVGHLENLNERYDLIMLHIGGNDIVRATDLDELKTSIERIYELALSKADHVVHTSTGSIGTALLLPLGSRTWYERRTKKVRAIFIQAAQEHGVLYVDLFRERNIDPFATEPNKYYAADMFHPSNDGYEDWYNIISKTLERINLN